MEIIAVLTSLIYVVYSVNADNKLWFYGLVSSGIFVYICFSAGIYADMGINIYYVVVSLYGWVHWTFYKSENVKELPYSFSTFREAIIIFIVTALLFALLVYILKNFTNSTVPFLDSFTTALSITATWMLARKMVDQWLLWIIVDSVSVGLYYYKELYITSILFAIYTIIAISGFKTWREKWRIQEGKL